MSHALTVTSATALTVNFVPALERVHVKPARNGAEIIDRVRDASASIADVRAFLKVLGPRLDKTDLPVVEYALARAYYREGHNLSIRQVAILAELTVEKVRRYMKRLNIIAGDTLTVDQASSIMSAVADYN